jgi:hypothetical protein
MKQIFIQMISSYVMAAMMLGMGFVETWRGHSGGSFPAGVAFGFFGIAFVFVGATGLMVWRELRNVHRRLDRLENAGGEAPRTPAVD